MTSPNCNARTIGSWIVKGIWKIYLDDYLCKFGRVEVAILFTNYGAIKHFPRYDWIVDGFATILSKDSLLSLLEVLKCEWASWWVLSQFL